MKNSELLIWEDKYRDCLESLSLINQTQNVKIVTERCPTDIQIDFAQELSENSIFYNNRSITLREKLLFLLTSKFISVDHDIEVENYLQLLKGMGFKIAKANSIERCF